MIHNQIRKFLVLLIESDLVEIQTKYIIENDCFKELLDLMIKVHHNRQFNKANPQHGFVGQMMLIARSILKSSFLTEKLSKLSHWNVFMNELYNEEILLENHILGDIFITEEDE